MANAHEILVRAGLQVDADGLRTVGTPLGRVGRGAMRAAIWPIF